MSNPKPNFIMQFFYFVAAMLSDNGEPSSKRGAGFLLLVAMILIYTLRNEGMPYEDMVTWLAAALVSLGISGLEKIPMNRKRDA